MNVGGAGPGGNMMNVAQMNMQVSESRAIARFCVYILNRFPFLTKAANVRTATSTAASATQSTNDEHNGTTKNDVARKSNACSTIRDDEFWHATTTTSAAGKQMLPFNKNHIDKCLWIYRKCSGMIKLN